MAKKENKEGYILSYVGFYQWPELDTQEKKQSTLIKNSLEIISLNETIDSNNCHLHISFSYANCNIWARH